MLKKVFGIPSWLPDNEPDRTQRAERINRLFKQLNDLWPDVDILVIAQNWKNFKPIETKNKQIIKKFPALGILGARHKLREEFLKAGYDYLIMMDDDCIIQIDNEQAPVDYMAELDKHPNGFCFIRPSGKVRGSNAKYHPYIGAQLNLCAISKYIYEREPMVNIDAQKNEGYEDSIYACLLHHKWAKYEFIAPATIRPIQFMNHNEKVPSTWANIRRPQYLIAKNTHRIQDYIIAHKEFPPNYKSMIEKEYKQLETEPDGHKKDCYLYF